MLVGQSIVEPGVEEILIARSERPAADDEDASGEGSEIDEPALLQSLVALLSERPAPAEEIRRLLTEADRAGLDWSRLLDEAAAVVTRERPYLIPGLPPKGQVAPRA